MESPGARAPSLGLCQCSTSAASPSSIQHQTQCAVTVHSSTTTGSTSTATTSSSSDNIRKITAPHLLHGKCAIGPHWGYIAMTSTRHHRTTAADDDADNDEDNASFERAWAALRVEHGLLPQSPPRKTRPRSKAAPLPCQQHQQQQQACRPAGHGHSADGTSSADRRKTERATDDGGNSDDVDRGVGRGLSASCRVALLETPSFALRRLPSFALGGGGGGGGGGAGGRAGAEGDGPVSEPQQVPPSAANIATMFADIVDETLECAAAQPVAAGGAGAAGHGRWPCTVAAQRAARGMAEAIFDSFERLSSPHGSGSGNESPVIFPVR